MLAQFIVSKLSVIHFQLRPHAPGTHYHLTLDPAVLWTLSNDSPQDPPVQTVLIWCHQPLCIFGLCGTIQVLFYYYKPQSRYAQLWLGRPTYATPRGHLHNLIIIYRLLFIIIIVVILPVRTLL